MQTGDGSSISKAEWQTKIATSIVDSKQAQAAFLSYPSCSCAFCPNLKFNVDTEIVTIALPNQVSESLLCLYPALQLLVSVPS
jgi:hypothetical protein